MTQSAKHGSKDFICPSHIANSSLGLLESMGCNRHPIRALGIFIANIHLHMFNRCHLLYYYVQMWQTVNHWVQIQYIQEVDSKIGEMIYPLWKVVFMKFMPNEQISTGNTWEIHENRKKVLDWILEPIGQIKQITD